MLINRQTFMVQANRVYVECVWYMFQYIPYIIRDFDEIVWLDAYLTLLFDMSFCLTFVHYL